MRNLFIAGTDTGVGKTHVATAIVRALVRDGLRVAAMKPVAAGADPTAFGLRNDDALALAQAANVPAPYETINPWCLPMAASPHIAAAHAGIVFDIASIRRAFDELAQAADIVVVEGAGGWLAPVSDTETMADIAAALDLRVVLVVGLRLGCLNHAQLTANAIKSSGLELAGWVANHLQPHFENAAENVATLVRRLPAPLLEVVPYGAAADAQRSPGGDVAELSAAAVGRLKDALSPW